LADSLTVWVLLLTFFCAMVPSLISLCRDFNFALSLSVSASVPMPWITIRGNARSIVTVVPIEIGFQMYLLRDWHFIAVVYMRLEETAFHHSPMLGLSGRYFWRRRRFNMWTRWIYRIALTLHSCRDSYLRHASSTNRRRAKCRILFPFDKEPACNTALTRAPIANDQFQCFPNRKRHNRMEVFVLMWSCVNIRKAQYAYKYTSAILLKRLMQQKKVNLNVVSFL